MKINKFNIFLFLFSLKTQIKSRNMRWAGRMAEERKVLVGKTEVKRPLGRPSRR
jgi:hypothetical protein